MSMEHTEPAIIVKGVSKRFRIPVNKASGIKQSVVNIFQKRRGYREFSALSDVSFEIQKGEFFGVVGRNGSGKSTLLKILAGVYTPDSGGIAVNGTLTPFIELGVGFNPELTGRENVFLNGALLGFSQAEIEGMYDDIINFAELGEFMEERLKNYSSGMQVRLAFSIAIRADTDILVLDEVLAVGDDLFQKKCFDYFARLKKTQKTVILVSHDKTSLERFCDRAVLIDEGKVVEIGPTSQVVNTYSKLILEDMNETSNVHEDGKQERGTKRGKARIVKTAAFDKEGTKRTKFEFEQQVEVRFDVEFLEKVERPIMGVTIWQDDLIKPIYAINTTMDNIKTDIYYKGDKVTFSIQLPDVLNNGEYTIEPAIADEWATAFFDRKPNGAHFYIAGNTNPYSVLSGGKHVRITKGKYPS